MPFYQWLRAGATCTAITTRISRRKPSCKKLKGLFVKFVCVGDIRVQILAVLLVELGGVSLWSHHDTVVITKSGGDVGVGVPLVVPMFAVDQVAE